MPARKPTPGQLAGILWLALFTLGTETLPDALASAGGAAWLCPLLAGGGVVLWGALLSRKPLAGRALLSGRTHPVGARVLAGLYLLWGVMVTACQGVRVGQRLSDDLRGSPLLLTAAALALAAWMASGGLAPLGRACRIFMLAVGLTFFLIVLFGLSGLRWDWLVLWTAADWRAVPVGAVSAAGILSAGTFALFLLEDLKLEKGARRRVLKGLGTLFVPLVLTVLLVTGRLGPGLAGGRPTVLFPDGLRLGVPGRLSAAGGTGVRPVAAGGPRSAGAAAAVPEPAAGQAHRKGRKPRPGVVSGGSGACYGGGPDSVGRAGRGGGLAGALPGCGGRDRRTGRGRKKIREKEKRGLTNRLDGGILSKLSQTASEKRAIIKKVFLDKPLRIW